MEKFYLEVPTIERKNEDSIFIKWTTETRSK